MAAQGLLAVDVHRGEPSTLIRAPRASQTLTGRPQQQSRNMRPNVKLTGAARFYRAASVLTAGLDRISFDLPLSVNDVSKVARLDRVDFDHERTTCVGQATP